VKEIVANIVLTLLVKLTVRVRKVGARQARQTRSRAGRTRSYVGYLDSCEAAAEFSIQYLAQARCSN
jgi:hypothetical protein